MDAVIDVDAVAREFTARRPAWAARGVQTSQLTWRDATATWPQPLPTDRTSIIDPESVGMTFSVAGAEIGQLVIWCGGWADLVCLIGERIVVEAPEFSSVAAVVTVAEDLIDRITAN